jgi:dihydroxyacetone kinase-like predicted kinase
MYTESKIIVVPSKNIGMGYVALSCADLESDDPDAILAEMTEAMSAVTTGFISPSIRDADLNGIHVNNGDTIGIIDKEIVISDPDFKKATHALASMLLNLPDKFMLTVFCGKDASIEESSTLEAYVAKTYPSVEIYFIDGGQEVYPYLFVAE